MEQKNVRTKGTLMVYMTVLFEHKAQGLIHLPQVFCLLLLAPKLLNTTLEVT